MTHHNRQTSTHKTLQGLRGISDYLKPYSGYFVLLLGLTILSGVLMPLEPFLIQHTVDEYIIAGKPQGLTNMAIILCLVVTIQGIIQYTQTYLGDWLGQQVVKNIRLSVYEHILRLRIDFINQTPIGHLVTRTTSDTETMTKFFKDGLASFINELLQIILIILIMFYSNWQLAIMSLTTTPIILGITYIFQRSIKHSFTDIRNAITKLNSFLQERIAAMSMIQVFGREQAEMKQFEQLNDSHRNANIRSVRYHAYYFPFINLLNSASTTIIIAFGAKGALYETVTLGQITAFLMYSNMLFRPLHLIADRFKTLHMGIVSMGKIMDLLKNGYKTGTIGTHAPQQLRGDITFQNVWFGYQKNHYALQDISFHLKARESLAIVGATGAGKTTIINLLNRFYDAQKGQVSIDGINVQDFDLQNLRKHVGLVLQDVSLFSGSVYDNITLQDPNISAEQVYNATKLIGLHDFILQLPKGYGYNVTEHGMTFSMGQRQLLSFARMLVYNPTILVLDEATASLDVESERLVQKAMALMMRSRTCILIAHRLTTIQQADKILVLKQGKIQESGTHTSLLAQQGYYAQLCTHLE